MKKIIVKIIKFFYLFVGFFIEIVGDIIFFWKLHNRRIIIYNSPKILIVKIDQLGDVMFSTFLLPIIKKYIPNAEIHYIIHSKAKVLLEKNPHIKKVYLWDEIGLRFIPGREKQKHQLSILGAFFQNIKTIFELRKENYDIIINARAHIPSSNIWWFLAKSKFLIAFDIAEHSFLADVVVTYELYDEEWKNYLKLLEPFINIDQEKFQPEFYNYQKVEIPDKKFVVIAPVSFDREKQWKKEYWQNLIKWILNKGFVIILSGKESQKSYLEEIVSPFKTFDSIIIKTDFSIPQLAYVVKHAAITFGIESFPVHLALAIEKNIVCLINEHIYYVPQMSKKRFCIYARSMIPKISKVHIYSTSDTAEKVINDLEINNVIP